MNNSTLGHELPRLVERITASFLADERTQHIDKHFLPSRAAIIDLVPLLLELGYPGFHGRQGLTRFNVAYHVGDILQRLSDSLRTQIEQCLRYERERTAADPNLPDDDCARRAAVLTRAFLDRIPAIRELLAEDAQAAYDGDPAAESVEETILSYPGVLAITIHRFAHELYAADVPMIPRILSEHAHFLTGIDIHPGARIGRRFFIDHGTGVVIGETADVGDNVKIYQGVTLGALSFPKDARGRLVRGHKRHPTVGNNVTIYANAIILGGQTFIGDGAVVGGSVFLTHSVQPGHRVTMPAPTLQIRSPQDLASGDWDYAI